MENFGSRASQPLYEAKSQILISLVPKEPVSSPDGKLSSLHEIGFKSHEYLAQSALVINNAVEKFRLHELTSFGEIQSQNVARTIADALTTILVVDESPDSMVLEVRYQSTNYVDAMTVVKAVIRCYLDSVREVGDKAVVLTPADHCRIVETPITPAGETIGWKGATTGFLISLLIVCILFAFRVRE
jgi:hypothetical protein